MATKDQQLRAQPTIQLALLNKVCILINWDIESNEIHFECIYISVFGIWIYIVYDNLYLDYGSSTYFFAYTEYESISNIKPYAFVNPVDMYLIENENISKTIEIMKEPADDQKNIIACNFAQNG